MSSHPPGKRVGFDNTDAAYFARVVSAYDIAVGGRRTLRSEVTITGLAEKVRDVVGSKAPITYIPYDVAYEVGFEDMQRRVPDISKIRSVLGWEPLRTLDDIIRDVRDDQMRWSGLRALAA